MDHHEMVELIRLGIPATDRTWAEMGAGNGNFTRALADLLPPTATIYAVDRDAGMIDRLHTWNQHHTVGTTIIPLRADFTLPVHLPPLDGILMANALHFVGDQALALSRFLTMLRPSGRLVIVEYDIGFPRPWIPFPVPWMHCAKLVSHAGFVDCQRLAERRSPSNGMVMYAASAFRPC